MEGKLYIDGAFRDSQNKESFEVRNPYTMEVIGRQASAGEGDLKAAFDGATEAFDSWKRLTAYERAEYLRKLDQLMKSHEKELARIITEENGKPLAEALGEVRYAASYVTWYAEEGIRVVGEMLPEHLPHLRLKVNRVPIGPAGIITPWNFPLAMFVRKMAPALAAGCTVVVKPAGATPLTAVKLFELIHEAGFPKGVCQLVTGESRSIGKAMMAHKGIKKVSFTGSTEVGKDLLRASGETLKKLSLELGGHAPFIVFEDADLNKAVQGAMESKFRNCGQVCIATNRVLVQRSVYEEFTAVLEKEVRRLTFGDGLSGVDMGPIINEAGYLKITEHVEDALKKGARLVTGGKGMRSKGESGGFLFQPTILADVTEEMKITREETFGPVLPIMVFDTEEQAYEMANSTPYGLAAYAYSRDLSRSYRITESLDFGIIGINSGRISAAQAPFGGMKESGFGREGGTYGIEDYLVLKYTAVAIDV
ncbi:MAG: NAD-dependent succinate-semialdehyde dehydrogenase [delta proteobacterium ML8_F1]|nr:MAG: NAD-dependent succinate-semialdehyde dehydrogenase [delta proteobacterium ML8_F1]